MGDAALSWPLVVELLELSAILGFGVGGVLLYRRSAPATLERRQKRVESTCVELGGQLDEISAQRAAWKAQGEALTTEVETYFDRIERKRASTAASASKISAGSAPVNVNSLPREQQLAWARGRLGG